MASIRRTAQARQGLLDIGRYIAKQSGSRPVAERFLDRMETRCWQYARSPLLGDIRDDLGPDVRCFRVGSYVVIYQPLEDGILILLVIHPARDIPAVFRKTFGTKD